MTARHRNLAYGMFVLVGIGSALVYEATRSRPSAAAPVTSPLPVHPDETERLEGGYKWIMSRGGKKLFQLHGGSMYRIGGGTQVLREVERLALFLEDGRTVEMRSHRGRMKESTDDRERVQVTLDGAVKIRDPDGLLLETERLDYDSEGKEIRCVGKTLISGDGIRASADALVYRPDSRLIEGLDSIDLWLGEGEPWRVETRGATYRITTGELVFDSPLRARRDRGGLVAGPAVLQLARGNRPARFSGSSGVLMSSVSGAEELRLASATIDVTRPANDDAQRVTSLATGEPASTVYRRQGSAGREETVEIASSSWSASPNPDSTGWTVTAGPGYQLKARASDGSIALDGEWLDVQRSSSGEIVSITGRDSVEIKGPEQMSAWGERLRWHRDDPDVLEITGEPATARKGADLIEASRLQLRRLEDTLVGLDGVVAEIRNIDDEQDGVFDSDQPVRIRGKEVRIPRTGGEIVFTGPVQAWQETSTLRSGLLTIDQRTGRVVAEQEVSLRLDDATPDGTRTTWMRTERLDYSGRTRLAVLTGRSEYRDEQAGLSIRGDVLTAHLADGGEIERLEATGAVLLTTPDAIGTSDRLTWEQGVVGSVWLIGEQNLATLRFTDGSQTGTLKVSRLRYDLESGEAHVESGPGRGTLETGTAVDPDSPDSDEPAPPEPPARDGSGKLPEGVE